MQILNKVLDRRQHLGMTREELAALTGLTTRTIYTIESGGDYDPKLSTMIKLAKALRVKTYSRLFAVEV